MSERETIRIPVYPHEIDAYPGAHAPFGLGLVNREPIARELAKPKLAQTVPDPAAYEQTAAIRQPDDGYIIVYTRL